MLLQRRADEKYHSAGLWTNTGCSHPRPGEATPRAAARRLKEEMGLECDLKEIFQFIYKVQLDKDFTEHELDHVFIGFTNENPQPDPAEVSGWKWISTEEVLKDINEDPAKYTYWFREVAERLIREIAGEKEG
jgi:isopentenyl-diphosphate delta-isomerase